MGLADLELLKEADMKLFLAVSSALRVCAVLCPGTRIPRAVIAAAVQRMGLSEREVVAELCKRGLLVEDARTRTVTMAAATQAEVLAGAGDADKLRVRAAVLLLDVWPDGRGMEQSAVGLALGRELLPHAVHLVDTCAAEVEKVWDVAGKCVDTLSCMGLHVEATRMARRYVALGIAVWGALKPCVLRCRMVIGATLSASGKHGEAAVALEETLAVMWRVLGKDHQTTLQCTDMLVDALRKHGDPRAVEVAAQAVATLRRVAGPQAEKTLDAMGTLGAVQCELGKPEEAEATQRSLLESCIAAHGEKHMRTLWVMQGLAGTLCMRGELAETARLYRRVVKGRQRVCGKEHPLTNGAWYSLAITLIEVGKFDEARTILQRLMRIPVENRGVVVDDQLIEQSLARITTLEQQRTSPQ